MTCETFTRKNALGPGPWTSGQLVGFGCTYGGTTILIHSTSNSSTTVTCWWVANSTSNATKVAQEGFTQRRPNLYRWVLGVIHTPSSTLPCYQPFERYSHALVLIFDIIRATRQLIPIVHLWICASPFKSPVSSCLPCPYYYLRKAWSPLMSTRVGRQGLSPVE